MLTEGANLVATQVLLKSTLLLILILLSWTRSCMGLTRRTRAWTTRALAQGLPRRLSAVLGRALAVAGLRGTWQLSLSVGWSVRLCEVTWVRLGQGLQRADSR